MATVVSALMTLTTPSPLDSESVLWVLILGMLLSFLLAAGMGANDVANTFGTSVGSGTLTLSQAYILASIFEALGAILVGWSVADTLRKGVVDTTVFVDCPKELMIAQIAALGGCSTWLVVATLMGMPVSATHSVVGGTLGYSLVLRGFNGIRWSKLFHIVLSWFISPLTSGAISTIFYIILDFCVLRRENPFVWGMRMLPVFYFLCIAFNVFMVTWKGSKLLRFDRIPLWGSFLLAIGHGLAAVVIVQFIMKPNMLRKMEESSTTESTTENTTDEVTPTPRTDQTPSTGATPSTHVTPTTGATPSIDGTPDVRTTITSKSSEQERESYGVHSFYHLMHSDSQSGDSKTLQLFGVVQIVTACFAGFAHGAQDISNAVAPAAALISIYSNKSPYQKEEVPIYVLLYGVFGSCVGLWTFGERVITTIGTKVAHINPASGFTIEFGAAVTSLLASKLGLPISTTHCLVGSVVAVAYVQSNVRIKWPLLRNIAIAWVVTIPASAGIAAILMLVLKLTT